MGFFKRLFGKEKKAAAPPPAVSKRRERSYPDFPEGDNHIDDADVKTINDLHHYYVLPQGHTYRIHDDGSPYILRSSDGLEFKIIVEASMMTFDEPYDRGEGKIGYKTTEVFKKGVR